MFIFAADVGRAFVAITFSKCLVPRKKAMNSKRPMRLPLLTLLLLIPFFTFSQSGVIKGRVINSLSNEPVPFATVSLQGTTFGTNSDENGQYEITRITPGEYNVEATSVGFKKLVIFEIQVTNARPTVLDITLQEEGEQLSEVEITASSGFFKPEESPLSLRTIGATEIKRTPGGNRDISKVIRSLPGVASPPSFRNDIIIRGGAPTENTFYLDGIQIPVINHFQTQGSSGGPVGMINVDLLQEVNFYSGAFPAERGNTLSSIFDFKLKDPRLDKWTVNGIVGASDLGISVEGPVTKSSSLVLSVRRSYLKFLFSLFNLPFLPVYNDLQFKYKIDIDSKNKITLLGIGAIDDFTLNFDAPGNADNQAEREEAEYLLRALPVTTQWNYTTGIKYQHFRDAGVTSVVLSTNKLTNDIIKYRDNDETDPLNLIQDYSSTETEYRLRVEDYVQVKNIRFTYGVSLERADYRVKEFNQIVTQQGLVNRAYNSNLTLYKWGLFGQASRSFLNDKLTLSAGLRADANDYSSTMRNALDQLSPRISISYALTPLVSLNANSGIYYQLPAYTVLGYRENGTLVNKQNDVSYIQSKHLVGGVEFNLERNSRITVEGFYKQYLNYPFQLDDSISLANLGADFGTIGNAPISSTSKGRSYGLEFLFQQKLYEGYYGLLSYTIVRSEFEDKTGKMTPSSWDYGHLISLTGGKRFNRNWEVGFRFLLSGGAPYTPYNLTATLTKENWDVRPYGIPDYNQLNTARTSVYHQLDIRIDKKYFFPRWSVDIYLDIQNLYNFQTKFQDNIDIQRDANGTGITDPVNPNLYLPKFIQSTNGTLLPSIGLIVEF